MSSRSEPGLSDPIDPLEAALRDLRAYLESEILETPGVAARVRTRIEREDAVTAGAASAPRRVATGRRFRLVPAVVGAVALIVVTASLTAIPAARHALADLLGLPGDRIELRQPRVTVTTAPADNLGLGPVVSLSQARAGLPGLLVPTDPELGSLTRIVADARRPEVTFVYAGGAGPLTALVSEWRADAGPFFQKMLGAGSHLESVPVNGGPGVWVSGPDHFFFYTDAQGGFFEERGRLAGNALIWQQGSLTLRIEGAFTKERALAIAASLR